ncbi:MAG: DUF4153 domain-containing protein [Lachnospiraceae bacterium]|nr:DUF4153 domain-containing protein [Lachnospiraceae bacterium]
MKEKLKNLILKIGNVFRDYPVTLGCIVVIAAIGAVIIDCDFNTDLCEKVILFLGAFSVQALFFEEHFKEKTKFRIIGYAVAVPVSAFLVYLASYEDDLLFGAKIDKVQEITACIYGSCFACLILASIYHMYRRQNEKFETFCLKAFVGIVRTTVVYGLFAGGLAIIILIFDTLIFDTHAFLGRVELFLAGGIYVPALLLVLSGAKDDVGKFARIVVLYVLEPMLILAMAIIYIYIIKVFVTGSIPSNSVFEIITSLFVSGMVIWTLACGTEEDNIFSRIAKILPFVFIPCILLQAWSVLLRIGDYGFTPSRYFGVVLVIFELIYMVLYFIQWKFKKDTVSLIIWVAALTVVTVLIVPFVNYASVCVRSQIRRLSGITVNEALKVSEQGKMAGSAYHTLIRDCGYRGDEAVEKLYTETERDILNSCYSDYNYRVRQEYYLNGNATIPELDVSEYKKLIPVEGFDSDPEGHRYILEVEGKQVYNADLSGFIRDIKDYGRKLADSSSHFSFDLSEYEIIRLDEHHDLKVTRFSANYIPDSDTLDYLNINGYLLER